MAVSAAECERMIEAARESGVKLMVAYRLHFEEANLRALEIARSGKLGEPRIFSSTFSMQVKSGNIRTKEAAGGGTLYDIGIYCLQAARQVFGSDPVEVLAMSAQGDDPRFREVDEMTSACASRAAVSPRSPRASARPTSPRTASSAPRATCASSPPTNTRRRSRTISRWASARARAASASATSSPPS
jgi:predicted dehydrogenase